MVVGKAGAGGILFYCTITTNTKVGPVFKEATRF